MKEVVCSINAFPKASIAWSRLSAKWPSHFSVKVDGRLKIQNATTEDSGIYVCTGQNVIGSASAELLLFVRDTEPVQPTSGKDLLNETYHFVFKLFDYRMIMLNIVLGNFYRDPL